MEDLCKALEKLVVQPVPNTIDIKRGIERLLHQQQVLTRHNRDLQEQNKTLQLRLQQLLSTFSTINYSARPMWVH